MSFSAESSAETTVSAEASDPTLQDFVLNLINDEAAKAAYLADPLSALSAAGLADLTPADVQEVLPLVADGLPAGLPTDLAALPVDVPGLDDLPVSVPEFGDLGGLPTGLPDLGALPVALPELGDLPSALPTDLGALPELGDLTGGLPVDVPAVGDLTGGLPSLPELSTPVGDVSAVVNGVSGLAGADLDGDCLSAVNVAGAVSGTTPLADFGGGVVGQVGGEFGAWAGVNTVAGDVVAGGLAGQDGLEFAVESPLADIAADSHGDFSVEPGNLNDLLDADNLGTTGDAVAGTVAHYVAAGTGAVAGGVATGTDALGGYLTGSASMVGEVIDSTSATVTDGIQGSGDMVSGHLTNLPDTDGLPLDQLPELPQLPDISSDNLPEVSDVTGHLPVDVPSLNLPDTSGLTDPVTDLVSHNPVTGVVGSTPVGGTVDGLTDHLSQVTDHIGNLDLGL